MDNKKLWRRNTKALLWAMILVWPFGQLLSLPSPNSQIRWFSLDLFALLLGISLLFKSKLEKFILTQPLTKPISLFLLVLALSLVTSIFELQPEEIFIAGSYWFRLFFYSLVYFVLRLFDWRRKRAAYWLAGIIFLVLAFSQYIIFPDARALANLGFDDHYYRLIGTFFDPNFTGLMLASGAILVWSDLKGKFKLLALIPLIGLSLTFSRASYLAFMISLFFLAYKKKWWSSLGLVPLLIFFILLAPKPFGEGVNLARTYSIESRVNSQMSGLELFKSSPLLGHGFNTLAVKQAKFSEKFAPIRVGGIDNSFIYILATSGVVGLTAFLYFLYSLWIIAKPAPQIQAVFVAILFHSWWNNSFFYPWVYLAVMVLADYVSGRKFQTEKS